MHSPWHIETAYWAAVILCDKLPILHACPFFMAWSTLFQTYSLVIFEVFPIHILFNTQTNWITGKSTDVKITTYVFSIKDPHIIKIYYYQHKKGGSSLSTFTTTEERCFDRSMAYAGCVCNTAKNITWCYMLIWHWFRRKDLIEWSQNNLMTRVQHQESRNLASPCGSISDYLCNHG